MQTTRVPLSTNTNGLCTQGLESSNYMSCSAHNAITMMRKRSNERSNNIVSNSLLNGSEIPLNTLPDQIIMCHATSANQILHKTCMPIVFSPAARLRASSNFTTIVIAVTSLNVHSDLEHLWKYLLDCIVTNCPNAVFRYT